MLRSRTPTAEQRSEVEALYREHARPLLIYLTRRTADPEVALDLWSETFAQAVAGAKDYRGGSEREAAGWLYGIARNQLAAFYRSGSVERRAMKRLELERPVASASAIEDLERDANLDELRTELESALGRISQQLSDAVRLRVIDDLDYSVVASRLGISEGAARVRVSRGLSTLSDLVDPSLASEAWT